MDRVELSRRDALGLAAATAAAGMLPSLAPAQESGKGRLNQSVCRWCYGGMSLEDLCANARRIGLKSVELLGEREWATVKAHGLTCAVANGPGGITDGWNDPKNHDKLVAESERLLPLVAAAGLPNMIVFSGNRRGITDAEGLERCAQGLKRIAPLAERHGVTLVMELLNSRVDHGDYQCDRTPWGVELVNRVGSDRFRLLYDVYHMQIMEGDVIRTIERHHAAIGHYHTGGNPGRNEIDATQELNYRRIAQAIADTGFKGYVAHEFIPKRDAMKSLAEAVEICTV
ncbi:MAG: hydroxypyruvate isomerase family protein [Fimbriimonas sp.]